MPTRTTLAQSSAGDNRQLPADSRGTEQGIDQVSYEGADPSGNLQLSDVAAVVNGTPILLADVLEPHALKLAEAERQLPPERFAAIREQLIRRDLPRHIDETVLMTAALSQLDAEKRTQLEQQLDEFFTQSLKGMQEKLEAGTLAELEAKLQAQGTTLSSLRRSFGRQQLAKQGMLLHRGSDPSVTRLELLAEYRKRIADYQHPAQVKWQQIWISHRKHGGEKKAHAVLEQAVAELHNGADFDAVAKKYSDGVMAAEGGHWDWTQKGSLANPEVERVLFELSIGEIGEVIADERAFQIVRVTQRRPDRVTPFEDVQNDIRGQLVEQKKQTVAEDVLKRLKQDAVVTTMFDAQ